jgi:hypothetical protein
MMIEAAATLLVLSTLFLFISNHRTIAYIALQAHRFVFEEDLMH